MCSYTNLFIPPCALPLSLAPSLPPSPPLSLFLPVLSRYGKNYFLLVYCFLGFNVGDYIGRVLAGLFQWPALVVRARLWFPVRSSTRAARMFTVCSPYAHHVLTVRWPCAGRAVR